jgi:hypothetical protein
VGPNRMNFYGFSKFLSVFLHCMNIKNLQELENQTISEIKLRPGKNMWENYSFLTFATFEADIIFKTALANKTWNKTKE